MPCPEPAVCAALADLWAFRAQSEHEARARFVQLSAQMNEVGAPTAVLDLVGRAPDDELRHRDACAEMARRFGHHGRAWRSVGVPRIGTPDLDPLRRTLWGAVAMGCVAESMNVALLGESLRVIEDPQSRETTRAIMADEVRHARIGWGFLAAHREHGDFIGPLLPRILAAAAGEELFEPSDDELEAPAWGLLGRRTLQRLFVETAREVVLPGLRQLGTDVDAGARWLRSAA